ncbi:hypothetical protein, partial [Rhizobium sp.]|uniref:hypothetical protein n=1 Tax=Rhizobium sp. TaxID=391 RepID=UPI00289B4C8B
VLAAFPAPSPCFKKSDDQPPSLPKLKIQDPACHAITNLCDWGIYDSLPYALLLKGHKYDMRPFRFFILR